MSNRLKRRQEIELQIEKVAFGGKGIAYVDEYVVFVDECLPGDRLIARITKSKKNYAEGYVRELLTPSPLRREAPCAHFSHCGGCKWQHVDYAQQLQFKRQHVEESLRHIGRVSSGALH